MKRVLKTIAISILTSAVLLCGFIALDVELQIVFAGARCLFTPHCAIIITRIEK